MKEHFPAAHLSLRMDKCGDREVVCRPGSVVTQNREQSACETRVYGVWRVGCRVGLDGAARVCYQFCMDEGELALNDERKVMRRGSKEWRRREWDRYRQALSARNGLFPVYLTALQLGVSRQRVHQMFDEGILERLVFFDHIFAPGDEIDALVAMEQERRSPAFRIGKLAPEIS